MEPMLSISQKDLNRWLAEIPIDRVDMQVIIATARYDYNIYDTAELKKIVIDAIRRILAYPEIIAVVERVGKGTDVLDFEIGEILRILETHWDTFVINKVDKVIYDFLLVHRAHLSFYEKHSSQPFTIFKETPAEFL